MAQEAAAEQKIYVTRTGLPLAIVLKWPFHPSNSGADFWVLHTDLRLLSEPTLGAAVSVNLAETLREALGELTTEKCEAPVLSCLRKEVDNLQIEFLKSGKLLPVNFGSRHYNLRKQEWMFGSATEADRETLLRRKTYWVAKAGAGAKAWMADAAAPGLNRPMSQPWKSNLSSDCTLSTALSPNDTSCPAERPDATAAISSTGKRRSASVLRISRPTAPVAPTTATL